MPLLWKNSRGLALKSSASSSGSASQLGASGEEAVVTYFLQKNYRILGRNIRSVASELDLIVEKDQQVVFVEVKTMRHSRRLSAQELTSLVPPKKLRALGRGIQAFLGKLDFTPRLIQADLMVACLSLEKRMHLLHYEDFFSIEDYLNPSL